MPDFRDALYARYVSQFKAVGQPIDDVTPTAYWRWCDAYIRPLLARLDRSAPLLEIGCGPGLLLEYLARQGFAAQGVDASPEQVALAQQRGLRAAVADLWHTLESSDGTYGTLVAVDVLEHFTRDEIVRLAPLLSQALRPGGWLLVQTVNGAGLFPRQVMFDDFTHLTVFTPRSFAQVFRPHGFGQFAFFETGPAGQGPRATVRKALWRGLTAAANAVRTIETGKRQAVWTENFLALCQKVD